ncbi:Ig-like domain-containing protein, partial [Thorsellia kenyensis]
MPNFKVILTNTANKTANVRTIKGKTEINVTNQDVVIIRHAKKNTFIGKEKFEVVRKGDDLEIILSENPLEVLVLKGFYLTDGTIKITAVTGDDTLNAINEETQSLLTLSDGESVSIDFTGQQFEVDTAVFDEFDFDSSGAILLAAIVGIGAIIAGGEIFSDTKSIGDVYVTPPGQLENIIIDGRKPDGTFGKGTPTIKGKGDPDDSIIVDVDTNGDGKADDTFVFSPNPGPGELPGKFNPDGTFEINLPPDYDLPEGDVNITVTPKDSYGNKGPGTDIPLFVDKTAPNSPEVDQFALDNIGDYQGNLNDGDVTDDTRPTFTGKGEPDGIVNVYINGEKQTFNAQESQPTVDSQGNWTFELPPSAALKDGDNTITFTVTDKAGNESDHTPPFNVKVDTSPAPEALSPDSWKIIDDANEDELIGSKEINNGDVTDDNQPTLSGTAPAGVSQIAIFINGKEVARVDTNKNGNWTYQIDDKLNDGDNQIEVAPINRAGNIGEKSSVEFTVDTNLPSASNPMVSELTLTADQGTILGAINNGSTTDDATPVLSGKAEPSIQSIKIYLTDPFGQLTFLAQVPVDEDGVWQFDPPKQYLSGANTLHVVPVTAAGYELAVQDAPTYSFEFTGALPSQVALLSVLEIGDNYSMVNPEDETNQNQLLVRGSAEPNTTVNIMVDGRVVGTTTSNEKGYWEYELNLDSLSNGQARSFSTFSSAAEDGVYKISASMPDSTGGIWETADWEIKLNRSEPAAPELIEVLDHQGAEKDVLVNQSTTDDTLPILKGKGLANSTIEIYDNGLLIGTTKTNNQGEWIFVPPNQLANGLHSITMVQLNKVGNKSQPSEPFIVNVDSIPGNLVITSAEYSKNGSLKIAGENTYINDNLPTIKGIGPVGAIIEITVNDQKGTAVVDDSGHWSFKVLSPLNDGDYIFKARIVGANRDIDTDELLSAKEETFSLKVLVALPDAPIITEILDTVGSVQQDVLSREGKIHNDPAPYIKGTGEPGYTVNLYNFGKLVGTTIVKSDGSWELVAVNPYIGENKYTVTTVDMVNDESTPSPELIINYDPTLNTTPWPENDDGLLFLIDDVQTLGQENSDLNYKEFIARGETTNDNKPTFTGKAPLGAKTIKVYLDGEEVAIVPVIDGSWSYTPDENLEDGEHKFEVAVLSQYGNEGPKSKEWNFIVDTSSPGSIENLNIEGYNPDTDGLNTTTPTITGKGEAGQDVVVTLPNGEELVFSTDPKEGEYPLSYGPTDGNGKADFALEIPEGKLTDNTSGDLSVKQR